MFYTHIAQLMTHTTSVYIVAAYLPCNYVIKPFGIWQRVIKNQKVCTSAEHSKG